MRHNNKNYSEKQSGSVLTVTANTADSRHILDQQYPGHPNLFSQDPPLTPPFPDGLCGGQLITIPPKETFSMDAAVAGKDWLLLPREIFVWIPPGYNSQHRTRFPVVYCHDGQNAMQDDTSWTGHSWRLAGALTRLYEHKRIRQLPIVVLLPSAGYSTEGDRVKREQFSLLNMLPIPSPRRHLEYGDTDSPFATAYTDFVANTVRPFINEQFRTDRSASATFTMGTSLGGQASLHLLLRHADKFGGAACLSPAFGTTLLKQLQSNRYDGQVIARLLRNKRLYLDMGGTVQNKKVPWLDVLDHVTPHHWWNPGYFWLDTHLQSAMANVCQILQSYHIPFHYLNFPGARHNERAWSKRIHEPLQYLLTE